MQASKTICRLLLFFRLGASYVSGFPKRLAPFMLRIHGENQLQQISKITSNGDNKKT